ncbi:SRPBCC family protein [Actinophytocola sp.]|uniref:SRPBCC family protein n=1 Tax=Actinophytocola sp. TaxID=1872138 RepID=UPI0039C89C6B
MKLEHTFSVPADLDTVWQAVVDPERVAPCMPGATLTEVNGSSFSGTVKVKLGPISLLYKGSGEFLEADEQAHRLVIKASGKDSKGNGTAAATVTVTLQPNGDTTNGSVQTDLTITGKPAQFGRGMISEVGGKILDTFANCLATKLAPSPSPAEQPAAAPEPSTQAAAAPAAATPQPADPGAAAPQPAAAPSASTSPPPAGTDQTSAPSASAVGPATPASSVTTQPSTSGSTTTPDVSTKSSTAPSTLGTTTPVQDRPGVPAGTMDEGPPPGSGGGYPQEGAEKSGAAAGDQSRVAVVEESRGRSTSNGVRREAAEPETEPIDLLQYAGPSVLKRVAPLIFAGIVVVVIMARRRRSR